MEPPRNVEKWFLAGGAAFRSWVVCHLRLREADGPSEQSVEAARKTPHHPEYPALGRLCLHIDVITTTRLLRAPGWVLMTQRKQTFWFIVLGIEI